MDDDYRKYGTSRAAHFEIEDPHKCFVCGAAVPDGAIECPKCHFPQNGDEVSQRRFLGELRVEKKYEGLAAYRVDYTFQLLLGLPIVFFKLSYDLWQSNSRSNAQIFGLLGLVFLLIWIFGRQNPPRAFWLSLAIYAVFSMPLVMLHPVLLANGYDLGCLMAPYFFLSIGLYSFRDWKKLDDDLKGKNSG